MDPSNARAFVLQLGGLAGAILSIVAVVQLALPHGGGPSKPAVQPVHRASPSIKLSLASESVHVETERQYLNELGQDPGRGPSPELDARGFSAPYTLTVRGYRRGSRVHVRFQVWRLMAGGDRHAVSPIWDHVDVDRDPDVCTCASTFIRLPPGKARYKLVIGVFPPGTRETNPGSPLKSVETEFQNIV